MDFDQFISGICKENFNTYKFDDNHLKYVDVLSTQDEYEGLMIRFYEDGDIDVFMKNCMNDYSILLNDASMFPSWEVMAEKTQGYDGYEQAINAMFVLLELRYV